MKCNTFRSSAIPCLQTRAYRLAVLILGLTMLVAGCGESGPKKAANTLSGKVTLDGQPVTGIVVVVGTDGKKAEGLIKGGGDYSVDDPPQGDVKILVKSMLGDSPPELKQPEGKAEIKGGLQPPSGMGVPPPPKYALPENGLPLKVTGGHQKHDIALKS